VDFNVITRPEFCPCDTSHLRDQGRALPCADWPSARRAVSDRETCSLRHVAPLCDMGSAGITVSEEQAARRPRNLAMWCHRGISRANRIVGPVLRVRIPSVVNQINPQWYGRAKKPATCRADQCEHNGAWPYANQCRLGCGSVINWRPRKKAIATPAQRQPRLIHHARCRM